MLERVQRLPTSQYALHVDGRRVGYVQVRHRASHGPAIPPMKSPPASARKAADARYCALGLIEARKIGLTEDFVGADEANAASWRVIEKNGGELVRTFLTLEGVPAWHYRIGLA